MAGVSVRRIACVDSGSPKALAALDTIRRRHQVVPADQAEVVVALGGDGLILHSLHRFLELDVPLYGMNCGTVGFLTNELREDGLLERIDAAETATLSPLRMTAVTTGGTRHELLAFNEVSLIRYSAQSANLRVLIDGIERVPKLVCDGILLATPAGSTAYNFSAGGSVLPLQSDLMALTPISPFRPRRWGGAILTSSAVVEFVNLDPAKRPLGASADFQEVEGVVRVEVRVEPANRRRLLFDPGATLEERILGEQFAHGE